MAGADHYFSAEPSGAAHRRAVTVRLAGREREVVTASGVFSPGRIDPGTRVLLENTPTPPPSGQLLDLGCGWGPLALSLALESPHAVVWAVDVNQRALDLVRTNADSLGLHTVNAVRPEDVPSGLAFDTIVSNPPIRIGKPALHELLEAWLPRIEPDADAWLVVQRHLGADSLQRWLQITLPGLEFARAASSKGYRVLRAHRPAR